MSINTGFAPIYSKGMFVAVHVKTGVKTSSPGFIPARRYARCKASVPLPTASGKWDLRNNFANEFSKSSTRGPWPIHLELRTSFSDS